MKRLLVLLLLAACGPQTFEFPNPDGGAPLATCNVEWCTLPDGGVIGAP